MNDHYIFGYGSLVNRATHGYEAAHRARLTGWRRAWRHTTLREVAFLNAVPEPGHEIAGLVIGVPREAPELDSREYAYTRTDVTGRVDHRLAGPLEVNVFAIPQAPDDRGADHVLLLSYIDVVVQGYLHEYGHDGVRDFFESTDGWEATVINDRAAPRYPRSQAVKPELTKLVDHWLAKVGAKMRKD